MGGTDSSSLNFLTLYTIMSFLLWKEFQEVETLILKSFTLDFFYPRRDIEKTANSHSA